MTQDFITKIYLSVVKDYGSIDYESNKIVLFLKIFKTFPFKSYAYMDKSGKLLFDLDYRLQRRNDSSMNIITLERKIKHDICKLLDENTYGSIICESAYTSAILYFGKDYMINVISSCCQIYHTKEFNFKQLNFLNEINIEIEEEKPTYNYITISNEGHMDSTIFTIENNYNIDINKNFNDDIPLDELINFCKNETCGLSLLHGIPGCGKTTFIKNLINKVNKSFYLLDASLLANITTSSFLSFLLNVKDSIFILEDCEKLLVDRKTEHNPWISTLLNITDGMLGEGLNIKFICTFNSDISSIDKALLREGRLKVCYEFKKLNFEKSKVLCKEMDKKCFGPMTLAEIYKTCFNNSSLNKLKKVGF